MKATCLLDQHRRGGGKLVEFAGYEMPIQYAGGILAEHRAVRTGCGLFDVSHMGRLSISGGGAFAALQKLVTNDLSRLADGGVQYNHVCREDGGVLDDVLITRLAADRWAIVCNASNHAKISSWLERHAGTGVEIRDETVATGMIAVQGPGARERLQPEIEANLSELKYYRCVETRHAGKPTVVSRTGYTGEDGFEVILPGDVAGALWERLLAAGATACGLGCRDTLRLEAGMPLYGHELSEARTPLHAGLDWVVKLEKGDFIGRDAIRAARELGFAEKLAAFEISERGGIPRQGYPVSVGGAKAGEVTSGVLSPTLGKNIGLAYVPPASAAPGSSFEVEIRGRRFAAAVVPLPFYKRAK